jgi:hypothetical protein
VLYTCTEDSHELRSQLLGAYSPCVLLAAHLVFSAIVEHTDLLLGRFPMVDVSQAVSQGICISVALHSSQKSLLLWQTISNHLHSACTRKSKIALCPAVSILEWFSKSFSAIDISYPKSGGQKAKRKRRRLNGSVSNPPNQTKSMELGSKRRASSTLRNASSKKHPRLENAQSRPSHAKATAKRSFFFVLHRPSVCIMSLRVADPLRRVMRRRGKVRMPKPFVCDPSKTSDYSQ